MAFKPIQILINAKDEASGVFDRLNSKIRTVAVAVAGYFGIKSFVGAVQGAAELEEQLSRVAAAADGGAEEMAALRAAAEQAGAETKYTATEAAGALENLVKAGMDTNTAIGALPATLALAQAGDIALAESAEVVTKAMAGMGLAVEDTGRIADVLAKGANATNSSVRSLADALSYAAPNASAANLSLEGTVALLGKMEDAGIGGTRAGTALANMLAQFSDPASKFRNELAAIGITTNNFEDALHQLAGAGAKGEKAILAIGLNAGPGLRALLNQGMPALDALRQQLDEAEGSAQKTADTMAHNLAGAARGLSSAWEGVKNALMTPVLPVLKDGVEQLTGALRGAISDGTVKKFGDALASAFRGAIDWIKQFAASFNWDDITARLQAFATDMQARMEQIGQWATTAGTTVQTAWGVMAGGTNVILAAVYKVGEAFAGVASNINAGVAWIAEKLSSITFGDVSKRFAIMAAEMRAEAHDFWATSQTLAQKAGEAFDAAAEHAQTARKGFGLLKDAVLESESPLVKAVRDLGKEFTAVGTAATQAGDKAKTAAQQQAQATDQARKAVDQLRAAYDQAVQTGDWQRAAELMGDLKRATDAAAASAQGLARDAQAAAAITAAAFERAGIHTKEQLADMARLARQDFELIKQSGQASADGLAQAFKRAADAAIAANNGIVPGWVQAQASVHGYTVAVDEAGKATLQTAQQTGQATNAMTAGWHQVTAATQQATAAAQEHQRQMDQRYGRAGQSESLGKIEGGWGKNADGQTATALESIESLNRRVAQLFGEQNIGNEDAIRAANLRLKLDQIEKYGTSNFPGQNAWQQAVREEYNRLADRLMGGGSATTYVSNITLPSGRRRTVRAADRESQDTLADLVRELGDAKRRAA